MPTKKPIETMTEEELMSLSDEEIRAQLDSAVSSLEEAVAGGGDESAPISEEAPADEAVAEETVEEELTDEQLGDQMMNDLPPEIIQQATARLVAEGIFTEATNVVTPELIASLQVVIDMVEPGLYDLTQPEQLMELLNGIIAGTIDIASAASRISTGSDTGAANLGVPAGAGAAAGVPAGNIPTI